jgi:hypothetical protein
MGADVTRVSFDPTKGYAGVLKQQGRVALDADWNELVELIDRRWRSETIDIIGRCAVPRSTKDAFLVDVSGAVPTIGVGRAYVDGLQAECRGAAGALEFDASLGEERGSAPMPLTEQPFAHAVAAGERDPFSPPLRSPALAYLEVWERDVDVIGDPELREVALGGPDTTTRIQTAWQVRFANWEEDAGCPDPDDRVWAGITAPSTGRLTTGSTPIPQEPGPCVIEPEAGYGGTDNRLYRVQIHDGDGAPGGPTFKWSRDNASLEAAVTSKSQDPVTAGQWVLSVSSLGRDRFQHFAMNQYVELLDDHVEWSERDRGHGGPMLQIVDLDEGQQTVTVTDTGLSPASGSVQGFAIAPERHPRIRRWNSSGLAGPALSPIVAGPVVLEDGVQIAFTAGAGPSFRSGEYWVFAVRTANGSVETLQQAPARGPLHHFCPLATLPVAGKPTDCRILWPPESGGCECDVCITPQPGQSADRAIQAAIDSVKDTGGTICLGAGIYLLEQGLRFDGAKSVRLVGKGWRTILISQRGEPCIAARNSVGLTIEDMSIVGLLGVSIENSIDVTVQRCAVLAIGGLATVVRVAEAGTGFAYGAGIRLGRLVAASRIRENLIVAGIGVAGPMADRGIANRSAGWVTTEGGTTEGGATEAYAVLANVSIRDNVIGCTFSGVELGPATYHLADTRIADNLVLGCAEAGLSTTGTVLFSERTSSQIAIAANTMLVAGSGVIAATAETAVIDNEITSFRKSDDADGIRMSSDGSELGFKGVRIAGNRIRRFGRTGVVCSAMAQLTIEGNLISDCDAFGIQAFGASAGADITVDANAVTNIGGRGESEAPLYGISIFDAATSRITDNVLSRIGIGRSRTVVAGIYARSCAQSRILGNEVTDVAPNTDNLTDSGGIVVEGGFESVDVANNHVRRRTVASSDPDDSDCKAISVGADAQVQRPASSDEWIELSGNAEWDREFMAIRGLAISPRGKPMASIRGNLADTFGTSPAIRVVAAGICTVSDNRAMLIGGREQATIEVEAGAAIVSANFAAGPQSPACLRIDVGGGAATVLGNITSGAISLDGATPLAAPWDVLNVLTA